MNMNIKEYLHKSKIIAAVKDEAAFSKALESNCKVIFLLNGEISTVGKYVAKCHERNKLIFLHFDMIEGFGKDEAAVRFVKETIKPDGIISIKSNVIKWAENYHLPAIFRVFLVDSQSVDTAISNIRRLKMECVEIMPGIIPDVIRFLVEHCPANYIGGGLISTAAQVAAILESGASACSTSNQELWNLAGK
jgi:glycerol uptake operon antiterminator